jgi:putative ABC transport system ATP-binding protein
MIELKNISKTFQSGPFQTNALANINLSIKKGEFVTINGPSGSGKTTLLNIIGGLDSKTGGEIFVNNRDIGKLNDKDLSEYRNSEVGFVSQEFYFEPKLSVKDNVLLPTFFNHKTEKNEKRAEKLIEEVELTNKKKSKITELSGGQKQRTVIARALINNPTIILADEPTGNLDAKTGKTIIELLKNLHKTYKITLIIATHDAKIAEASERTIHLKEGRIISK